MRDYVIMTDSCCDLTDQMARDLERLLASLGRDFSLQEAVTSTAERSGLLWQDSVNDIQQFLQDEVYLSGGIRPGDVVVGAGSQLLYPGRLVQAATVTP